jgi:hypothetical protein
VERWEIWQKLPAINMGLGKVKDERISSDDDQSSE